MKTAAEEYEDAVANGRIVHPIGYRTARGFVLQADRMIESAALQLPASDAASLAEIRTGLALIKQAFVRLNTPERSALDEKALFAAVKRVEQAAGKLTPRPANLTASQLCTGLGFAASPHFASDEYLLRNGSEYSRKIS